MASENSVNTVRRTNKPQEAVIYTDMLAYSQWAKGVGSREKEPGDSQQELINSCWELLRALLSRLQNLGWCLSARFIHPAGRCLAGRQCASMCVPPTATARVSSLLEDKLLCSLHIQAHFLLGVSKSAKQCQSWQRLKLKKCSKSTKCSASTRMLAKLIWNKKGLKVTTTPTSVSYLCWLWISSVTVSGLNNFFYFCAQVISTCSHIQCNFWHK